MAGQRWQALRPGARQGQTRALGNETTGWHDASAAERSPLGPESLLARDSRGIRLWHKSALQSENWPCLVPRSDKQTRPSGNPLETKQAPAALLDARRSGRLPLRFELRPGSVARE